MSIKNGLENETIKKPDMNEIPQNAKDIIADIWKPKDNPNNPAIEKAEKIIEETNTDSLKIGINDIKKAEHIRESFAEVDKYFTADKITCPEDAKNTNISLIEEHINDKPIEEVCAILTYFTANKIALSKPITEDSFNSFKLSNERSILINEVKETLVKANGFTDWLQEVGEQASEAKDNIAEMSANVVESAVEFGHELEETAGDIVEASVEIAQDVGERVVAAGQVVVENATQLGEDIGNAAVDLAESTAEMIVDGAEAGAYVAAHAGVGAVRVAENCADFVDAVILDATGQESVALDVLQSDIADELSSKIDAYFDPSDTLKSIGHAAETAGEVATAVGLTVIAMANVPAEAAVLGSTAAATAVAATSLTLIGLNEAGSTLRTRANQTGEIGAREITAASVAGVANVAATAAAGLINGQITRKVANAVVNNANKLKLTVELGARITGVLSSAAVAGTDTGLMRAADMASDITNVALGLEDDFDVVQELRDTAVSVAGASVLAGVGYDAFRTVRGSTIYQNWFNRPYTPDYFDNLYREVLNTRAIDITIRIPDGWTEEQIAQAKEKLEALQNAELVKTPVERDSSSTARYRRENDVPSGMDVDHTIELQLGGADDISNMNPIDSSVNRSFGSQIESQIRDLAYGTPIRSISFA